MTKPKFGSQKKITPMHHLLILTLIAGIAAGLIGLLLETLLHTVQHIAYGYGFYEAVGNENFLESVRHSLPERRVIVLFVCGLIAGLGWFLLSRFAKKLVNLADAVTHLEKMPAFATTIHVLLQIITVGLGSPLGREAAPREAAVVFTDWLASKFPVSPKELNIILASAAGAALGAVYNVPLSGALFALEVLLGAFDMFAILIAFGTSSIAVGISWIGLGYNPAYHFPDLGISLSLIIWSIVVGPLFGVSAYWFRKLIDNARQNATKGLTMIPMCLINFTLIGLLAIYFPMLLGNGKSPVELEFNENLGLSLSTLLLSLRLFIVWSTLRVGAKGGLLTPSLANGALLGGVLASVWCYFWPDDSLSTFTLVGAAAFLAASQRMPITATVLIIELTHIQLSFLVPVMLAVSGSFGVFQLLTHKSPKEIIDE